MAGIAPGVKTHAAAGLAFVGNTAFALKDYLDQLPVGVVTKYITADALVMTNLVLLSLVFWFRRLANKES